MIPPPRSGPACSFRSIPPAIYVAIAVNLAGTLALLIATLRGSGEPYERFQALERWFMLDGGCDVAYSVLLALGLLELAKRHTGPQRVLTQVAAGLGLASLAWVGIQPLIVFFDPSSDTLRSVYDWLGRGVGAIVLAGAVLLTIGADAWRRVPIAAAGLVVLGATGYWVPVIGKEISELVGNDFTSRQLYGHARLGLHAIALLFVVASLAAAGRDPAPDRHAAATSFRLARGVLMFRIVAAIVIAAVVVAGRSGNAAKFVAFAGPAVVVVTMLVFAVALQRIAGARLEGMPRLSLSLGAALTLWWGAIQFQQLTSLLGALKESDRSARVSDAVQWFSLAGPIAATFGLALVGSAIIAFARHREDAELRGAATGRMITFLLSTLASIGIQTRLPEATSPGSALTMVVFAAIGAIVGLAVFAGLLSRAAESLEETPGIPPARIV